MDRGARADSAAPARELTIESSRPARVVYVHGSGPQPPAPELKRALDIALFGADQVDRTAVAYYADLLHPLPVLESARVAVEVLAALPGERAGSDVRPERVPEPASRGPAAEAAFARRVTAAMIGRLQAAQPAARRRTTSGRADALLPRALRGLLLRFVLRFFVRDAHRYFFEDFGPPIRQRVTAVLADGADPVVVIGHSLGSVVAYDALSAAGSGPTVPLLVTCGSPLGIDAVKELVHQPPAVPRPVDRWLNVADPLDVVAADPFLADDYSPRERVTDTLVDNRAFSPHDLAGYLRTPEVRRAVAEGIATGVPRAE